MFLGLGFPICEVITYNTGTLGGEMKITELNGGAMVKWKGLQG